MAPLKSQKNTIEKKAVKKNKTKTAIKNNSIQTESSTNCKDNDFSKQTELSKEAFHRNDVHDTSSPLSVAITCDKTGILWQHESEQILIAIQKQIISEASSTKLDTSRPTFNSQPLFEGGILKLWCDNDHTLAWLKSTVAGLNYPGFWPVVKSQSEIKERVRCQFHIPDDQKVFRELEDVGRTVSYQNPWVHVGSWELLDAFERINGTWRVEVGVPEGQIPTLLKAGRRLSIGLMAVHIFFKSPRGIFNCDIPRGWDPATETFVNQPTTLTRLKRRRPSAVVPFLILSDAQEQNRNNIYHRKSDFNQKEIDSTQTKQSKQAIHRNDTQDTRSSLSVAITCIETGILSKEESEQIITAIQKQIISEANSTNPDTTRPTFNSQPLFEDDVLKLWCANDHTLAWLKNTVSDLCTRRLTLVVKSQIEIKSTSSPLSVAITCAKTGILRKEESELILTAIQKQIISEANSTNQDTIRPAFNFEPLFEEGVLKLWCNNDHTLAWLKNIVSDLCISRLSPVVKSQSEIKKRVTCEFMIPNEDSFKDMSEFGRAVWYQNPWVEVHRWELIDWYEADNGLCFVKVGVPEVHIPTLMKAGRHLSIGLTAVLIFFEGPDGKFNSCFPRGWDPATETIKKKPTTSRMVKKVQRPTVNRFVILNGAQEDYLHDMQKNNIGT